MARNAALAAGFAALPLLPEGELSTDQWLGLGLAVALLACVGLAVAVLALAREVGMLRLRLGPASALEVIGEGPDIGSSAAVIDRFAVGPATELAIGVFTSASCRVCEGLAPAVRSLAADPVLAVATFEEGDEPDVWRELAIPGAPFAVALDPAGIVLAKGAFNNLAQLESVVATAGRRRADRGSWSRSVSEPARRAFEAIAENTSRRGFLARVGAALTAVTAGSLVAKAVEPARCRARSTASAATPTRRTPARTREGPAAHRRPRLPDARPRRRAHRRPRPAGQRQGRAGQRARQGRCAIPTAARCRRRRERRSATRPPAATG